MGEVAVPDGIRAAEDAVQPTGPHSAADCLVRQPRGDELAYRDNAVLPGRQPGGPDIWGGLAVFSRI
jgi:hypothetical protein